MLCVGNSDSLISLSGAIFFFGNLILSPSFHDLAKEELPFLLCKTIYVRINVRGVIEHDVPEEESFLFGFSGHELILIAKMVRNRM